MTRFKALLCAWRGHAWRVGARYTASGGARFVSFCARCGREEDLDC